MNKIILLTLPALLAFPGCNAPADNNPAADNQNGGGAAKPATAPAPAQNPASTDGGATATSNANDTSPDPKYRVVNEANPGMPAGVITALEKVKVSPPPLKPAAPKRARVVLNTTKGDITVELNGEAAPLHAKSFLYLAKRGYYNGVTFHRFADLFEGSGQATQGRIIQGGDPLTKDPKAKEFAGLGGPGYQVPREVNSLKHEKFVLAAARSQDPDSAGSQFYFTIDAVPFLDEGDGYTVFGKVVEGKDALLKLRQGDKINKVTVSNDPATPKPAS